MAQYPNARISFGDIMQAVEDQLIKDEVVENAAQISWGTPSQLPQLSGPFDILLVARSGQHTPYDGGAAQQPMTRMLDIWYRSEAVQDSGGGWKTWLKDVFELGDRIIDSVGNDCFWPEDDDGNLLTIESIKLVGDAAPDYPRRGAVFADYVCTIICHYFPKIDPSKRP